MTERVYGLSGKAVEVAAPGSAGEIPIATETTLGAVMIGNALECSESGKLSICQAESVDKLYFDQPDDYSNIAAAIMATKGMFNELIDSLKNAGLMKSTTELENK
ncbi:hypothetical protein [Rouxiella sp. Mn2063]|uniref:hypothetical protein n=1 Tax=Rouxiella sp. Mn2063 TaxID=3395262 RepID=UPI003BBB8356